MIEFSDNPILKKAEERTYHVVSVKQGQDVWVQFLGKPLWVRLHWVDDRTRPCTGKDCPFCPQMTRRWKGYAPAMMDGG